MNERERSRPVLRVRCPFVFLSFCIYFLVPSSIGSPGMEGGGSPTMTIGRRMAAEWLSGGMSDEYEICKICKVTTAVSSPA